MTTLQMAAQVKQNDYELKILDAMDVAWNEGYNKTSARRFQDSINAASSKAKALKKNNPREAHVIQGAVNEMVRKLNIQIAKLTP